MTNFCELLTFSVNLFGVRPPKGARPPFSDLHPAMRRTRSNLPAALHTLAVAKQRPFGCRALSRPLAVTRCTYTQPGAEPGRIGPLRRIRSLAPISACQSRVCRLLHILAVAEWCLSVAVRHLHLFFLFSDLTVICNQVYYKYQYFPCPFPCPIAALCMRVTPRSAKHELRTFRPACICLCMTHSVEQTP